MLLDQVASDLYHRVERTLQDLLRPIADQFTCRLRHFLFVRLDQFSQLRLETKRRNRRKGSKRQTELQTQFLRAKLFVCSAMMAVL